MKIIVPMAGMGKRMRPHTLTVPKPLIPIAGKPIVQRLVEDIAKVCGEPVDEVAFIIGRFGAEVEKSLVKIAESVGAKGTIVYQDEPLGTAHAILCAEQSLTGRWWWRFPTPCSRPTLRWIRRCPAPSGCSRWKTRGPLGW